MFNFLNYWNQRIKEIILKVYVASYFLTGGILFYCVESRLINWYFLVFLASTWNVAGIILPTYYNCLVDVRNNIPVLSPRGISFLVWNVLYKFRLFHGPYFKAVSERKKDYCRIGTGIYNTGNFLFFHRRTRLQPVRLFFFRLDLNFDYNSLLVQGMKNIQSPRFVCCDSQKIYMLLIL